MEPERLLPFHLRVLLRDSSSLKSSGRPRRVTLHPKEQFATGESQLLSSLSALESDVESADEEDAELSVKAENLDIVALLTAPPSATAVPARAVLSEKELKQRKTEERLKKLMAKSSDLFNMRELQDVVAKMEEVKQRRAKKEVAVGGKVFAKVYKDA